MHTTFRVYGNAIGRTALGCRTVGRGFTSVARMKGGYIDAEGSVAYTDDTWNTERDIGDYQDAPLMHVNPSDIRFHEQDEEDRQHQENVKRMNNMIALDEIKKLKKEVEETKMPEAIEENEYLNKHLVDKNIDVGYEPSVKITETWNRISKLSFDEPLITEPIVGVFEITPLDFQTIGMDKIIENIPSGIMQENRSANYLSSHPKLRDQYARTIYQKHKKEKVTINGKEKAVLLSTIEPAKKYEYGMCGINKFTDELFKDVLPTGRHANFETTDSFCIDNDIKAANAQPIDLFDKTNELMSESKYYKSMNFIKMYNCNMLDQKDYFQILKKDLIKQNKILRENNNNEEAIFEKEQLLEILKTKESFLRSYYANNNYQSINISSNKWGVATNAKPIANDYTQLHNFKKHANTKIRVGFTNRKISDWTKLDGTQKEQDEINKKYKENLFSKNGNAISYDYSINVMFNKYIGLYNYTQDTLLDGFNHPVEVYKVGPVSDLITTQKRKGKPVTINHMGGIKIPVEKFLIKHFVKLEPIKIKKEKPIKIKKEKPIVLD
jgi:hypothetical protein